MPDNNEMKRIEEFALGPGALYMKRGRVSETELEKQEYRAGDTADGCILSYEYRTRELYDVEGNMAGCLRYGEKLRIKGKLCRVAADAVKCFETGDPVGVTVLFVCPLPNGESLRLHMHGGLSEKAVYDAKAGGTLLFEMMFGSGVKHPRFCLKGQSFEEAAA